MHINDQTDTFQYELAKLVYRFKREYDLNDYTIAGCLDFAKLSVLTETDDVIFEGIDNQDDYEEEDTDTDINFTFWLTSFLSHLLAMLDNCSNTNLPLIKIVSTEDEMFTKLNLEMEDSTHDMLVKWGKEEATDEDYISVALRCGLEEYVESLKDS